MGGPSSDASIGPPVATVRSRLRGRYNEAMTRPPDAPRTINEIAAVAGVSKSTVSRVLNDTPGVSPKARELVRSAIERTGYQPNRAARSLVTRATGSIGLVVSEAHARIFSDPFFASMVRGATEVVRPLGIHLVLMLAEDQRARDQLLDYLRHGHVDGVLFVSTHAADPLPRILVAERLPAVLSARPVARLPISYVDVDSVAGAGLAVEHLLERGRRRIATVAGPQDMPAGQDRLRGGRRRWPSAACHTARAGRVRRLRPGSGARAMEELLGRGVEFDGLFIASDLMALDAVRGAREHGLRVPDDVAVVGFDDSVAATQVRPALTTIRQPVEEMAKALTPGRCWTASATRTRRSPVPGLPAEAGPPGVDLSPASSAVVIARDFDHGLVVLLVHIRQCGRPRRRRRSRRRPAWPPGSGSRR